jgi:hypothetical protein
MSGLKREVILRLIGFLDDDITSIKRLLNEKEAKRQTYQQMLK